MNFFKIKGIGFKFELKHPTPITTVEESLKNLQIPNPHALNKKSISACFTSMH
jgi:hypothetical protein